MDNAGRISQSEHHAALDARDRREGEYRKRIEELERAVRHSLVAFRAIEDVPLGHAAALVLEAHTWCEAAMRSQK